MLVRSMRRVNNKNNVKAVVYNLIVFHHSILVFYCSRIVQVNIELINHNFDSQIQNTL